MTLNIDWSYIVVFVLSTEMFFRVFPGFQKGKQFISLAIALAIGCGFGLVRYYGKPFVADNYISILVSYCIATSCYEIILKYIKQYITTILDRSSVQAPPSAPETATNTIPPIVAPNVQPPSEHAVCAPAPPTTNKTPL